MRKLFATLAVVGLIAAGCTQPNANSQEAAIVNQQQAIYSQTQPVPIYDYSQDRATLLQIYNAKNEARQTWAVVLSNNGVPIWTCPSYGFPIPATTQLTNPSSVGQPNTLTSGIVLPQAEPDGLYTGTNLGTYVLCVRPNGDIVPIYAEPLVMSFPFAVKIVNGQIVDAGTGSTMTVTVKGGNASTAPQPTP